MQDLFLKLIECKDTKKDIKRNCSGYFLIFVTKKQLNAVMSPYDPNIHHRRSVRLRGYDYASAGWYFVTICTQNHECLFGNIENNAMVLNDAGRMVKRWYHETQNRFPDIVCHEMVVMPNHFHCI